MPAACRLGDMSAGHCFFPRPNSEGSPNVFINGIAAHRVGDYWPVHSCLSGDTLLYVNGDYIRIEDLYYIFINDGYYTTSRSSSGEKILSAITDVYLTKYTTELIKLVFDNGETLLCTPEHLIQLENGEYKKAEDLTEFDIL